MPITTIFQHTTFNNAELGTISSTNVGNGYTSQYTTGTYGSLYANTSGSYSGYISNNTASQSGTNGCRYKINHTNGTNPILSIILRYYYAVTDDTFHIYFNYIDSSNFYCVQMTGLNSSTRFQNYRVDKYVAGVRTQLQWQGNTPFVGSTNEYIKLDYDGSNIRLYQSTSLTFGAATYTDAVSGLSTSSGSLCLGSGRTEYYNNFYSTTRHGIKEIYAEADVAATSTYKGGRIIGGGLL